MKVIKVQVIWFEFYNYKEAVLLDPKKTHFIVVVDCLVDIFVLSHFLYKVVRNQLAANPLLGQSYRTSTQVTLNTEGLFYQ